MRKPRIRKGDAVKLIADISRRGVVVNMTHAATKARVKWDHGKPRRTVEDVQDLRRISERKHDADPKGKAAGSLLRGLRRRKS